MDTSSTGTPKALAVLAALLTVPGCVAGPLASIPSGTIRGVAPEPTPPIPVMDLGPPDTGCPVSQGVWLALAAPASGEISGTVPMAEVRGRAGEGTQTRIDLVIAIDLSMSAFYPSGRDLDGDGIVGELVEPGPFRPMGGMRPVPSWTTDPDDTVAKAEVAAAWRLVNQLGDSFTRVGLLTFGGAPRVRADVGTLADARSALGRVRVGLDRGGTDLGRALRTGVRMLERARSSAEANDGQQTRRVLVLLSDGEPTQPVPEIYARGEALRAADEARAAGVAIYAFALGADERGTALMAQLAQHSGGDSAAIATVGDVLQHLPYAPLAGIDTVEIANATARESGRAIRLFADGSFDGFVPLVPGENRIAITARSHSGAQCRVERELRYAWQPASTPADLADLAAFNERLEVRAVESDLASRVREAERLRRLQITTEP